MRKEKIEHTQWLAEKKEVVALKRRAEDTGKSGRNWWELDVKRKKESVVKVGCMQ